MYLKNILFFIKLLGQYTALGSLKFGILLLSECKQILIEL